MATNKELEQKIAALEAALAAQGIQPSIDTSATGRPEDRADYIAFGSAEHAEFLGLVEVGKDDDATDYQTLTSPETGKTWRLVDELEAVRHFPGIDPEKAARLLLRQKANTLDTEPALPEGAPPTFRP
jgi:hypothetical protein